MQDGDVHAVGAMGGPDCVWPAECLSDGKCHLFQANQSCVGSAAVGPIESGPDLVPTQGGVAAFWRSLVPRPLKHNF